VYRYLHSLNTLVSAIVTRERIVSETKKIFRERFENLLDRVGTYVVENGYVESEWRDSVELYYGVSHYHLPGTLTRIHFISEFITGYEEITEKNYLGYVTFRPVPVPKAALSRIRLKWEKASYVPEGEVSSSRLYVLSVDTVVNFPHRQIRYPAFRLYVQDGMVAVCAHADMLMVAKYMYKRFNFNHYRLREMVGNNPLGWNTNARDVPSEGLTITQMLEILSQNRYNPIALLFRSGRYNEQMEIIEYIDSFLESALPVILAFRQHVVLVVGHLCDERGRRFYLIADDSTYHLGTTFKKDARHTGMIESKELENILNQNDVYVIAPSFDRFYFHYPYLDLLLRRIRTKLGGKIGEKVFSRELLVDSGALKQFLYKHGDHSYAEVEMPHYVWYVEFYGGKRTQENLFAYMVLDASAHKFDQVGSIIQGGKEKGPLRDISHGMPQFSCLREIEE
jgi:hypothetical protein